MLSDILSKSIDAQLSPSFMASPAAQSTSPKRELRFSPRRIIEKNSFRRLPLADVNTSLSSPKSGAFLPTGTHSTISTASKNSNSNNINSNHISNHISVEDVLSEQFKYFRLEFIEAAGQVGVTIPLDIVEDTTGRIFSFVKFNGPKYILQMLPANTDNVHLVRCSLSLLITTVTILSRKLPEADKPQSAYWQSNSIGESISQWASESLNDMTEAGAVSVIINLMIRTNVSTVIELSLSLISSLVMISDEAAMSMFYPLNSAHVSDRKPIRHRKKVQSKDLMLISDVHDEDIMHMNSSSNSMHVPGKSINMERLQATLSPITRRAKRNNLILSSKHSSLASSPSSSPSHHHTLSSGSNTVNSSPVNMTKKSSKKIISNHDPATSIAVNPGSCLSYVIAVINKYRNKFMIIGGYAELILAICTMEGRHICTNIAMTPASSLPQPSASSSGHSSSYHHHDDDMKLKGGNNHHNQHHKRNVHIKPSTSSTNMNRSSSIRGSNDTNHHHHIIDHHQQHDDGWDGIKLPLSILARFLKYDDEWNSDYISSRQRHEMAHIFRNILISVSHLIIGSSSVTSYIATLTGAEDLIRYGYDQLKDGFDDGPAMIVKKCLDLIDEHREEMARVEQSNIPRAPKKPKEFKLKRLEDADRIAASRLAIAVEAVISTSIPIPVPDIHHQQHHINDNNMMTTKSGIESRRTSINTNHDDHYILNTNSRRASTADSSHPDHHHRRRSSSHLSSSLQINKDGTIELDTIEKLRMNYRLKRENESYRVLNSDPNSADYMFARSAHYDIKSLSHHIDHHKPSINKRLSSPPYHDGHKQDGDEHLISRPSTSAGIHDHHNMSYHNPEYPMRRGLNDTQVGGHDDLNRDFFKNLPSTPKLPDIVIDNHMLANSMIMPHMLVQADAHEYRDMVSRGRLHFDMVSSSVVKRLKDKDEVFLNGKSLMPLTDIYERAYGGALDKLQQHRKRVMTAGTCSHRHDMMGGGDRKIRADDNITRSASHKRVATAVATLGGHMTSQSYDDDRYRKFIDSYRRTAHVDHVSSSDPIPVRKSVIEPISSIMHVSRPSTAATTLTLSSHIISSSNDTSNDNKMKPYEAIALLGFKLDGDDDMMDGHHPFMVNSNETMRTGDGDKVEADYNDDVDTSIAESEDDDNADEVNDNRDNIDGDVDVDEDNVDKSRDNENGDDDNVVVSEDNMINEEIHDADDQTQQQSDVDTSPIIDDHHGDEVQADADDSIVHNIPDDEVDYDDDESSIYQPSTNIHVPAVPDSLSVSLSSTPTGTGVSYMITSFGPSPRALNLKTPTSRAMKTVIDHEIDAIIQSARTTPKATIMLSTTNKAMKARTSGKSSSKASSKFFPQPTD